MGVLGFFLVVGVWVYFVGWCRLAARRVVLRASGLLVLRAAGAHGTVGRARDALNAGNEEEGTQAKLLGVF